MAENEKEVVQLIENAYLPFLKKLLMLLEERKEAYPKRHFMFIYETFLKGDIRKKIDVFNGCKNQLDQWYRYYKFLITGQQNTDTGVSGSESEGMLDSGNEASPLRSLVSMQQSAFKAIQSNPVSQPSLPKAIQSSNAMSQPGPPAIKPTQQINRTVSSPSSSTISKLVAGLTYTCTTCKFHTINKTNFLYHMQRKHVHKMPLWCKKCDQCFINVEAWVSHIKENKCKKNVKLYRCGFKHCLFKTLSGQNLYRHLKNSHNSFSYSCVICLREFAQPQYLILHLQNYCLLKNNKSLVVLPPLRTIEPTSSKYTMVVNDSQQPDTSTFILETSGKCHTLSRAPRNCLRKEFNTPAIKKSVASSAEEDKQPDGGQHKRKRRSRISQLLAASDSEDSDEEWLPHEIMENQPARKSARLAQKVNTDNSSLNCPSEPEIEDEVPGTTSYSCLHCDFCATSTSSVRDHYVSDHKDQEGIQCFICKVECRSIQNFLLHFDSHEKANDMPHTMNELEEITQTVTIFEIPANEIIEDKVKSFEDLKSKEDIETMKTESSLKHFFKCVIMNCSFTTDDSDSYLKHLTDHKATKLHCMYCLGEYKDPKILTDHLLEVHGRRCYQCGLCFYRARSKAHVQIHNKHKHTTEKCSVLTCLKHWPQNHIVGNEVDSIDLGTTWSYVCATGRCNFQTYDPKEFKDHNDSHHKFVSVFVCHYCKLDFTSIEKLLNHYPLHGINNFQCVYCIHGSATKEESLLHLSDNHADRSFQVWFRSQSLDNTGFNKQDTK